MLGGMTGNKRKEEATGIGQEMCKLALVCVRVFRDSID